MASGNKIFQDRPRKLYTIGIGPPLPPPLPDTTEKKNVIKIFCKAFFSTVHGQEERIMKGIFQENVKSTDPNTRINLQIYYKSNTMSQLLLQNNNYPEPEKTQGIYRM